ncbi:MAG: hypothetical protein AAF211_16870, partial [Myxococcota bacterium]
MRVLTTIGLAMLATSCNRYDLFRVSGYEQATFTNRADVLFVIDNSTSMQDVSESLAVNFSEFVSELGDASRDREFGELSDAVDNYIEFVQNRGLFIDYQFGLITTDPDADFGAGQLLGPLVRRTDRRLEDRFIEQLACEAVCFASAPASDPSYSCGEPLGSELSNEYLECTCGGGFLGNCGTADEEALESVFMAMCRAVPNPPEACFAEVYDEDEDRILAPLLSRAEAETNAGLIREDSNLLVVIVSDEGDSSRRQFREDIPDDYERLFDQFGEDITWVLMGQELDEDGEIRCPSSGSDWAVRRYHYLARTSGGAVVDIFDEDCDPRPFDEALAALSDLLRNFLTSFALQSVPVPGTIVVQVDGRSIPEGSVIDTDEFGLPIFSDGWSYRPSDNSVEFHGNEIPPYESVVEVFNRVESLVVTLQLALDDVHAAGESGDGGQDQVKVVRFRRSFAV